MTTDHTTADQPVLDEILKHMLNRFKTAKYPKSYTDDVLDEAKATLLRWRTAEVRAVLERLPRTGRIESDGIRSEYVRIKDIDVELHKLEEGER